MITVSNSLSFVRAPLAFLFLQESISLRITAVVLAMITDSIDGYFARRSQSTSRFGAILDPAMDKFFVYFAMTILFLEGKMGPFQLAAMLSRDFFLCLYASIMAATGRFKSIVIRAIRWGKITTTLQFVVLLGLIVGVSFPWYIYGSLFLMGIFAFFEIWQGSAKFSAADSLHR